MAVLCIGVDVGNYDTKTPLTSTPSGFSVTGSLPFGVNEYLCYGDKYYVPSERRFPYAKDKTKSENCFILTLFAIAKEIIDICKKRECRDGLQSEIDKIDTINLCVGLPPAHMHMLKDRTLSYYQDYFKDGVSFVGNGYHFFIRLGMCMVVPQDYAAIASIIWKPGDTSIPNKYKEYYALDIGGATVDLVPIRNNVPIVNECISLELGVLHLYDEIMAWVEREYGITLSQTNIEDVLRHEETIIDEEIITGIEQHSAAWLDKIVSLLVQKGVNFRTSPVVFVGGGAQLFRRAIQKNDMLKTYEFLGGAKANAVGYKKYIKSLADKQRK